MTLNTGHPHELPVGIIMEKVKIHGRLQKLSEHYRLHKSDKEQDEFDDEALLLLNKIEQDIKDLLDLVTMR